jgi:LemA protein
MTESRIPEKRAEVFALASRLYTQKRREQSYSPEEWGTAEAEAQIPAECVEAALQYLQAAHSQLQPSQQNIDRRKKLWIGAIATSMALMSWLIWTYHLLTSATQTVDLAWHKVENQLYQQTKLIPNLIDLIQSSAQPERELAALLAQSQQSYLAANTRIEKIQAGNELIKALNQFQQYAVQNPQLRSNYLLTILQADLIESKTQLTAKQKYYNHTVQRYNRQVQSLPNFIVAPILGFEPKPTFAAETDNISVSMP